MQISRPFQGLFSSKNTGGNTRTENFSETISTSVEAAPVAAPDPTPATTQIGSGVGSCDRRSREISVETSAGVRVFLTERDENILRVCYEQQFLLREHIEFFFSGCSTRRVNFRIQQLIEGGFLRRESYAELGYQSVFRLTPAGRRLAQKSNPRTKRYAARLNSSTLFHDALVTSCRLHLSGVWNAEFLPERELKESEFPEVVDGLWKFKSGNLIALEVECSDKGRTRFLRRLQNLGRVEAIAFVLYVVPNERMLSVVRAYLKDSPGEQPTGVVLWATVISGSPLVETSRGQIDLLSQREW